MAALAEWPQGEERMDAGSFRSTTSSRFTALLGNQTVRRWISRAFIVTILVYFVVLGYLIFESVTGASRWAPYGVNIPLFIALVLASEVVMVVTAIRIFREDSGIWPPAIVEGLNAFRGGARMKGAIQMATAAWDIPLIDLRLRSGTAIFMGRANRVASIVPFVYALVASSGGAPLGLRGSAIFDIGISLVVWVFMEFVMVQPKEEEESATETVPAIYAAAGPAASANGATTAVKESRYSVRRVQLSDLDRLEELEVRNWKDQAASRDVIAQRIHTWPEGQLAAVHTTIVDGRPVKSKIAAWCSLMPASEEHVNSYATWDELTSNGTLSAYDPDGDAIIGVNLTSVAEGGTYILSAEALVSVVQGGKAKLMTGSRLTGFVSFNGRRAAEDKPPLSADAYARLQEIRGFRINEERLDKGSRPLEGAEYRAVADQLRHADGLPPLTDDDIADYVSSNVRAYMSIPGTRLMRVVPGYFPDPASADFGVIMEWPNPIPKLVRQIPFVKHFVVKRIREEIAAEWEQRKQHLRDNAARRARERVPGYLRKNGRREPQTPVRTGAEEAAPSEKAQPQTHRGT